MAVSEPSDNVFYLNVLADEIVNKAQRFVRVFQNVCCPDPFDTKTKHRFPIVILTDCGIYPFVEMQGDAFLASELFEDFDYKLRVFADCFHVRINTDDGIVLCAVDNDTGIHQKRSAQRYTAFFYTAHAADNKTSQSLSQADIVDLLEVQNPHPADESFLSKEDIKVLSRDFAKFGSEKLKGIVQTTPTFEQDPEKVFRLALFGGFLGIQRFYLKMYGTGILYFLTAGLLGIGWFFDCLEILLGVWRKKGKKLLPLPNRKRHVCEFVCVFGFFVFLFIVFSLF